MKASIRKPISLGLILFVLSSTLSYAQEGSVRPTVFHLPISDFTLPVYQGGELTLSSLKGKKVLLFFPRGHVKDNETWCNICQYQYADFADLVTNEKIQEKNNLEVVCILPYGKETVANWIETMPSQMAMIESWKFPEDTTTISEGMLRWMHLARVMLPKTFTYEEGSVPLPIPILMDENREVSTGLDLFRTDWSNSKCDQNIPTIIILDEEGVVQYKYISQSTIDRPSSDYILKFIEKMMD